MVMFALILVEHQFALFHMWCVCLNHPTLPPPLSKLEAKSILHGYSFFRLSWIAEFAVSWMQFVLKKGKASIDNMLIGPVFAIWVFKIGD